MAQFLTLLALVWALIALGNTVDLSDKIDRLESRLHSLEIPITDPVAWNPRVAEALDDLALRLRQIARSRDMNALMMAMETLWAIRTANQKISIPTKASRSG